MLAELLGLFPDATLFSVVDFLPDELRDRIGGRCANTTFIQRLPGARRHFRRYLPLMPAAIEKLPLQEFDVVLSSSHAVAKGAPSSPGQLHLCLCYTPMRYAWDLREQYLAATGLGRGARGLAVRAGLARLRAWDLRTTARVDRFAAISRFIAERIRRCYGRESTIVYPPVDTEFFTPARSIPQSIPQSLPRPADRAFYFTASRMVPYKRVDLIVQAFRRLPDSRLIVAGDGPETPRVRRAAGANVTFVGELPRERLRELLREARAFVFAAEEDFGLLPVEAQACGTPVIAYGRGGLAESVIGADAPRATGVLFHDQTPEAIAEAVLDFERMPGRFDPAHCVENAGRFSVARFRAEFRAFFDTAWRDHAARRDCTARHEHEARREHEAQRGQAARTG